MPDPFDQYAVKPQTPQATQASSDPFEKYAVGGSALSPTPAPSVSSSQGVDPFAAYATGTPSPNNGQPGPAAPASIIKMKTQPWYKKALDWAKYPDHVDFYHLGSEGAVGYASGRTGTGGFERGVENIASGLTAPCPLL